LCNFRYLRVYYLPRRIVPKNPISGRSDFRLVPKKHFTSLHNMAIKSHVWGEWPKASPVKAQYLAVMRLQVAEVLHVQVMGAWTVHPWPHTNFTVAMLPKSIVCFFDVNTTYNRLLILDCCLYKGLSGIYYKGKSIVTQIHNMACESTCWLNAGTKVKQKPPITLYW